MLNLRTAVADCCRAADGGGLALDFNPHALGVIAADNAPAQGYETAAPTRDLTV